MKDILYRPRRNRKNHAIRSMTQETRLHPSDFVVPLFVIEGNDTIEPIQSMPGINRYSIDKLLFKIERLHKKGISVVDLFTVVPQEKKDNDGSEAIRQGNLMQQAILAIKKEIPDVCVIADIALDPFTSHGHDGVINAEGIVLNDQTVSILSKMSLLAAEVGVDMIAPSDMMDGRVKYIRQFLDKHNFSNVGICSYAAKYASSFYGPFREALHSTPKFGDKKSYQMNPANIREALLECALDQAEGADMLLVKPALPYLDVISAVKKECHLPVGAYHVSGEYSMVMAAAERGWLNAQKVFEESLISIKRAGADFIFTYASEFIFPD